MRSIAIKLTLAFLLVGLTGAILFAGIVRFRTRRDFARLIMDQNQRVLVTNLTSFYQANGSWSGVEDLLWASQPTVPSSHRGEPPAEGRQALFVIANQDGVIVSGGGPRLLGRRLEARLLRQGVPLQVDGETKGWLLFIPAFDRWEPGTPESNFLLGVNQALLLSAVAATVIALVLGGVLAYTMTRPLRELTAATQLLAKGQLGHQVQVRSQDELGELATSFNQMSAELARSTELKKQMTADIAHDLRTPLSVLMGYSEALSDGKIQPTPEIFAVMNTEARHLNRLVEDLKTLSLADAGELPLSPQLVEPAILIQRSASAYRVQAERAGVAIETQISPDLPTINVDAERMVQVLGNLMSNALRYTPAGKKIVLSAKEVGGEIQIQVADEGPGIAEEHLPYLFERSFRGDKARQQQTGETGLGLAIAKSLVEAQGGKIGVQSSPGKGSVFTIYLKSGA